MLVKRTERGWAGHFIGAHSCHFRRNTLLEYGDTKIVVSTVGNMAGNKGSEEIGLNRYYETMAFYSKEDDNLYHDADVGKQVSFESEWAISRVDIENGTDNQANDMHERVVQELTKKIKKGEVENYD
jgi:hypothetical protein